MTFVDGNTTLSYRILTKRDHHSGDVDEVFTIGQVESIIYIERVDLATGAIEELTGVLDSFTNEFKDDIIIFENSAKDKSVRVLVGAALHEAEFMPLRDIIEFDDDPLFIYKSVSSWPVIQRFMDEKLAGFLDEMVRFPDSRIDLLLKRIGKETSVKLVDYINKFFALDTGTESPKKMEV